VRAPEGGGAPPPAPAVRHGESGATTALKLAEPADDLPAAPPQPRAAAPPERVPQSFAEIVALCEERREAVLRSHLVSHVHLVHFEPGHIECRLDEDAPRGLVNQLGQLLGEWTGMRWLVAVSDAEGAPTLKQQEEERERSLRNEVAAHPLVRAALETFPGATIAAVRERFSATEAGLDPADEAGTGEDEA
jgi:DNA polymerase-3 subunit gamma/tau